MEKIIGLFDELTRVKEEVWHGFEKDSKAEQVAWALLCEAQTQHGPLKIWADCFIAEKVWNPTVVLSRMGEVIFSVINQSVDPQDVSIQ